MSLRPLVPKGSLVRPIIPGLPGNEPPLPDRNLKDRGPDIREALPKLEQPEGWYSQPPKYSQEQSERLNWFRHNIVPKRAPDRPYSREEFHIRVTEATKEWNRKYGWGAVIKDVFNPTYGTPVFESPISVDESPPPKRDPIPTFPPPKPPGWPPDILDVPDEPIEQIPRSGCTDDPNEAKLYDLPLCSQVGSGTKISTQNATQLRSNKNYGSKGVRGNYRSSIRKRGSRRNRAKQQYRHTTVARSIRRSRSRGRRGFRYSLSSFTGF